MADKPVTITQEDLDRFVASCIEKGWNVRFHNHPKTRKNWPAK